MMKNTPAFIRLLILFLTLLVSIVATTLLFTLGLILIEFLLYPLALGISALLTGLTAVWLTNRLSHDNLQTPVAAVVRWCEATAVLLTLLLILGQAADWLPSPPIFVSSGSAIVLALVATYSAGQLRRAAPVEQPSARRIAAWLVIAFLAIPLVLLVASLFGWAGA
ncbi:MAG: hypothetical protein IPM53_22530 [Anaerolineaceae bacterium]|nr:hypothetical protein [Anaerolineaceae bacterium]